MSPQGHNLTAYQLAVLQHRLAACKVPQWSRVGRLKRKDMPKVSSPASPPPPPPPHLLMVFPRLCSRGGGWGLSSAPVVLCVMS